MPSDNNTGMLITEAPPPDIELSAVAIKDVIKMIKKVTIILVELLRLSFMSNFKSFS